MTVTEVQALIGVITGPLGLLLAAVVYFRDRAEVTVGLTWGMSIVGDPKKKFVVKVVNIGRRPIHVSHAHIKVPRFADATYSHLLLTSGLEGVTLAEGSRPHVIATDEDTLRDYIHAWWRLRATMVDGAGREYHSDWPVAAPAWAASTKPPVGALIWNRLKNWGRKRVF